MEPRELRDTNLKLIVEVADSTGERQVFTRVFGAHYNATSILKWLRSLGHPDKISIRWVD